MHNHQIPTNHSRKGPPNHANQLHLALKKNKSRNHWLPATPNQVTTAKGIQGIRPIKTPRQAIKSFQEQGISQQRLEKSGEETWESWWDPLLESTVEHTSQATVNLISFSFCYNNYINIMITVLVELFVVMMQATNVSDFRHLKAVRNYSTQHFF